MVKITNENFETEVLMSKVPVLLKFTADHCGYCKMQQPILEELEADMGDAVKIGIVDVDTDVALALKYQVINIPALVLMKDGIFRGKVTGLTEKEELVRMIERAEE